MSRKTRKAQAIRRAKSNKIRGILFAIILVVVVGAAGYLFVSALWPRVPAAAANTIDVMAGMDGFDKQEIHVKVGQPVTVRLTSLDSPYHTDGGGKHQWAVDELNVSVIAPPQGSATVTFTPTQAGTYTFYCDICCGGRANPTMQGKLVVEGA